MEELSYWMNQVKVDLKFQGAVLKISRYVVQPLTTQIDFSSFVMFGLTLFSFLATSSTLHQEWPVDKKVSLACFKPQLSNNPNRYFGHPCFAGVPRCCQCSDCLYSHWSWMPSSSWNTSATAWSTPACSDWHEFAMIRTAGWAQWAIGNAGLDRRFYASLYVQQSCLKHCSLITSPYPAWFIGGLSFS